MFIDDIGLATNKSKGETTASYFERVQLAVDTVREWSFNHGHGANKDKCCYMMFGEKSTCHENHMCIADQPLKSVTEMKYHGLYFKEALNGDAHTKYAAERIKRDRLACILSGGTNGVRL